MDINKLWIHGMIGLIDEVLAPEDREKLLERCGKGCAFGCGILDTIKQKIHTENPDEIFEKLRSPELFGERISMDGGSFYTTCEECFCPYVKDNINNTPSSYCECTRGWTKQVFETAFKRPAKVEIEQTIIRGAGSCRMKTTLL